MKDEFDEFDPFRMMKRFEKYFSNIDKSMGIDKLRQNVREPLVDISETDKEIKVTIELPGVDKNDIDLRVKNNNLIIKSTIKKNVSKQEEDMVYQERSYQQYYRTVPLPEYADEKQVNAKYNNGILEVIIGKKKTEKIKSPDRIQVK
jgi:HSP20 family protein